MFKINSLFGKVLQFIVVTVPFASSKVSQRPVPQGEVMPASGTAAPASTSQDRQFFIGIYLPI